MKKIILLICYTLLFVSCGGDNENPDNTNTTDKVLLREMLSFEPDGTLDGTLVFSYNSDDFLNKTVHLDPEGFTHTQTYIYENENIIKRLINFSDNSGSIETYLQDYFQV